MIDETVEEIEEMQTQSASVVAVRAAEALRELTDREYPTVSEFVRDVERNSSALRRANTSHAPLFTSQRRIVNAVTEADLDTVEAARARLSEAIADVVSEVESSKAAAGERAADLIDDGDVVLTHENSSTVMAAFDAALEAGVRFDVYVTEARPRLLGRKTARELAARDGVDATLIVDSAAGHYLPECDRVFVGMNCLIDDTVYNRIGTYAIALAADAEDVPLTVVASSSKFVGNGFVFENNYRSTAEVIREPADGFAVGNPAYDATPIRLVDSVVTENAVIDF
ncbi:MAG: translation initiation factor eIF-2B [Haloarculaceae archaeon]